LATERRALRVAVFGGADAAPSDPVYEAARGVGAALARAGYEVVTGGYGGVMEAASRGAREGGGVARGVTCEIFGARSPNEHLSHRHGTADLHERTRVLIELSDAFVVLPGKAGTLAELTFLWALDRAGSLGGSPVVLLGAVWAPFLAHLARWEMVERRQLDATFVAASAEDVVSSLEAAFAAARGKE
jgi:uncharacterized protein (TIGR00730 family)